MIKEDLQKEIERLNAEIREIKEDQNVIIKAFDRLQDSFREHNIKYHLKKKKWWQIL